MHKLYRGNISSSLKATFFSDVFTRNFIVAGKKCDNVLVPQYLNGSTTDSNQIYSHELQYTPSVSTIILSDRTYSSQNVRLTPEKCPTNLRVNTLSPTIWSDMRVDI